MTTRKVRMGIDVGGTHTKAVAIDNDTHEIIGKSSVKTTHDDINGVSKGVVSSFVNCLDENNINPKDVVFVAHSTTQATNALLEGDVAKVGVLGTAKGWFESFLAKRQLNLDDIDLGTGRSIEIASAFLRKKDFDKNSVTNAIQLLKNEGASVIVGSSAFGVDDGSDGPEDFIVEIANECGLMGGTSSSITKLYGLSRRTRTAAINGSILPKMLDTATQTEDSVRKANVEVPLMIMRGDGGVMDISEMKKRPVLTMLSGPAASVMGSLMYLRASNGIYFEVGGTSTNLGVIKNGRPQVDYSEVGGHKTFVSSLDVIVLGVAGGSMIRINKSGVIDIGPRSAHIAGLEYAVFQAPEKLTDCEMELYCPIEGDPSDYVKIKCKDGDYLTVTTSCIANAYGIITPDDFSYGNVESARKALEPVAEYIGITIEELCQQCLDKAYEKIAPVIEEFTEKYRLTPEQMSLIGVGGGCASLIKYVADKMEVKYKIPENAEVISSIGVALAMVRDVVERVIPNPQPEDIRSIRQEAVDRAIQSGASPDTIEVHIEIDAQTSKLTAIAQGSTEVQSMDLLSEASEEELMELAAEDLGASNISDIEKVSQTDFFKVFSFKDINREGIRVLDSKGFIKVQGASGSAEKITAEKYETVVKEFYESEAVFGTDAVLRPDYFICIGPRILDFNSSTMDYDQMIMLMDLELKAIDQSEEVLVIAIKNIL